MIIFQYATSIDVIRVEWEEIIREVVDPSLPYNSSGESCARIHTERYGIADRTTALHDRSNCRIARAGLVEIAVDSMKSEDQIGQLSLVCLRSPHTHEEVDC